jgi:outer membrane protein
LRLLVMVGSLVPISPACALDLITAYRSALSTDTRVAALYAQVQASRERISQAQAQQQPRLSASAQIGVQQQNLYDGEPAGRYTPLAFGLTLVAPLYRPANAVIVDQSRSQWTLAELQLEQAEQELALRVARAYFDVLEALDSLRVVRTQNRAIAEQYQSARRKFEAGATTITDQQEAQARLDLGQAQEVAAANTFAVRRAALTRLIGKPVRELSVLQAGVTFEAPTPNFADAWSKAARMRSLAVRQAELVAEVSRRDIDRVRSEGRPVVDIVGGAQHGRSATQSTLGTQSTNLALGMQLSMPLYTAGAVDARVREAIALEQRSAQELEGIRRQAEQTAEALFLTLGSDLERVRALETAETSSRIALDSNMVGYRVGGRINIDVLNAQQQLFAARRDLFRARYDVLVGSLALKASSGDFTVAALQAINALLTESGRQ